MALPRPCIECGEVTSGTRCPAHRKRPGYDTAERKRRKQVVDDHREQHGSWCPGYHRPPHYSDDLTADHVYPVAAGGSEAGPLRALCRSCNSAKRHRVR